MRRWVLLLISAVAAVALSKLIVENLLGFELAPLVRAAIAEPGAGAASAIVGLLVIDLFLPIPSSLVMVLSGGAFGVIRGALLSLAGSIGCSMLGFELTRRYGASAAARLVGPGELARLEQTFDRYGAGAVFMTRAMPIAMEAVSLVAGLSRMKRSTFLAATVAGTVPEALVYAWAGAASREASSLVPALVILIAVGMFGWMARRRQH